MRSAATLLVFCATASSFQWSQWLPPWLTAAQPGQLVLDADDLPVSRTPRIAIIGAGPAGTSAAYWLSLAKERANLTFEVDLYERSNYIGGRTTVVHPYGNPELGHVELGGSIFVSENRNLMRATQLFNLERVDSDFNHTRDFGVWDGKQFVFRTATSGLENWWGQAKAVWRYGLAASYDVSYLVVMMIKNFKTLFDLDFGVFDNIGEVVTKLEAETTVAQSGTEFFDSKGIKPRYSREIVEAATRVNYGTNLDDIHAFGALVCMSATNAYTVAEGNYRIFENFAKSSGANVLLDTAVKKISKTATGWELTSEGKTTLYDAVIVAAPLPFSGIKFQPALATKIPEVPYVHLHVTLLTTTAPTASAAYFGTTPTHTILTTYDGVRHDGTEPEFNSINYIRPLREGGDEWIVKIFSKKRITDAWLEKVFDGKVGWVHRKEWDAYPRLKPQALDAFPPVHLDEGLFYVNAFEPFVSTMDTQTIASRNVVDLLLRDHFKSSICPAGTPKRETTSESDPPIVYGFDC